MTRQKTELKAKANAARAFGIFAAVSVVRVRTHIRDPKEITVLLISLAIGLAIGVGRWDLAVVLTVFSVLLLWILEFRESEQIFRAMDLKVAPRNVYDTMGILREVLERHSFDSELRAINQPGGDDPLGSLTYTIDVSPTGWEEQKTASNGRSLSVRTGIGLLRRFDRKQPEACAAVEPPKQLEE